MILLFGILLLVISGSRFEGLVMEKLKEKIRINKFWNNYFDDDDEFKVTLNRPSTPSLVKDSCPSLEEILPDFYLSPMSQRSYTLDSPKHDNKVYESIIYSFNSSRNTLVLKNIDYTFLKKHIDLLNIEFTDQELSNLCTNPTNIEFTLLVQFFYEVNQPSRFQNELLIKLSKHDLFIDLFLIPLMLLYISYSNCVEFPDSHVSYLTLLTKQLNNQQSIKLFEFLHNQDCVYGKSMIEFVQAIKKSEIDVKIVLQLFDKFHEDVVNVNVKYAAMVKRYFSIKKDDECLELFIRIFKKSETLIAKNMLQELKEI